MTQNLKKQKLQEEYKYLNSLEGYKYLELKTSGLLTLWKEITIYFYGPLPEITRRKGIAP